MEDLDTSRDTCEQTSRSNRLRIDVRKISQAASNVRKSLHIQRLEAEVKHRQSESQANESSENLKFCKQ